MTIAEMVSKMKHARFKRICSLSEISEAENELGLKFSQEYLDLLTKFGSFSNDYFEVASIDGVVDLTKSVRTMYSNLPKDMYVLIDVGVDGIYILQNGKGKIFEIDDDNEILQSSNSFADYLERISKRGELWALMSY